MCPGDSPHEGTGSCKAPSSSSSHSSFLEKRHSPVASRDDEGALKGARFYVTDIGTWGPSLGTESPGVNKGQRARLFPCKEGTAKRNKLGKS